MASKPAATTRHLFQKKPEPKGQITSERIAADLKAFRKAGGRIEVLGATRVLTRIDGDGAAPAPVRDAPARTRRG
jgi:hypothetical protein